jgi:hypothetical protein
VMNEQIVIQRQLIRYNFYITIEHF